MVDRIADPWGERTPYGPGEKWPVRVDGFLAGGHTEADVQRWVPTASILHSNGDAMDIAVIDDRIVGVRGRAQDRINHGRVDPKDLYGWQANHSPDRLRHPLVREGGRLVETDWDTAMGRIVARSKELLKGPGGWGHFGFYTSGQLFLEEYYTLGVIGKAGIGTPHMDGNTRLCTATAAAALKASFGTDGQPGSYTDVDHCDAIALWGHNVAETQTVLWMRMLDRRRGPNPPAMLAVDPRLTPVAREADVHLALRNGTNVALLNGLLRELIHRGWYDETYVGAHTLGFDELCEVVEDYPIAKVAEICDLPVRDIERAAELVGTCDRLLSTVLQGFYQSNQATAAACQVNNLHLLRGMIGRPGAGLYQMNGQPTAQNNRECGADGDLPGLRNWENPEHVAELARLWNVEVDTIPHWSPPTHAMQIFRYAEQGSIKLLWVSATNPAVSMPDLARIRRILARPELFLVVQDLFLTETAELADVVLPAATWGEKTGTFTSVDRTVHISDKAVDPPGEARADLDIFLDYARRMDFRDRDGDPLITWTGPEEVFRAWQECSRGRPCDYTGISYDRLRTGGIQWPCTDEHPDGTERLYTDGVFNTDPDYCESYGHDLATGAELLPEEYRAKQPGGRAFLHAVAYQPSPEVSSERYPLLLTTGRTVYQFHTRTKTGRATQLEHAAPEVWVELNPADAGPLGVAEGDLVRIESPRGTVRARARICGVRPGVVFLPFHYGYWDAADPAGAGPGAPGAGGGDRRHDRAANELTITAWDPVSKQPIFKVAAVRVEKEADSGGRPSPAPTVGGSAPPEDSGIPATVGGPAAEATSTRGR
ncbi:molybdopterin oxidoreductase family protein [Micromonospora mirobrigensis]|uniref:Molydopterin dinucleotide binding domain-containing protein n=1 Tax=Micromonospora mirobrigensis TaxID=262898 RepID=A0A1C5APM5_9ACTN|nr:nitrate reductase [Micromonospora mirobrigensis]SCF47021.1 Molydopterin dinucleotide binding domain-containing protein [Micromonospora mirobrigensis]